MAQQYEYYDDRSLQQRNSPTYVYRVDEQGRTGPPQLQLTTTYYPTTAANVNNIHDSSPPPLQRTKVTRIEAVVREVGSGDVMKSPKRVAAAVADYPYSPRGYQPATARDKDEPIYPYSDPRRQVVDNFATKLQDEAVKAIVRGNLLGAYGEPSAADSYSPRAQQPVKDNMGRSPRYSTTGEREHHDDDDDDDDDDDHPEVICEDGVCRYKVPPKRQSHGSPDMNSNERKWGSPMSGSKKNEEQLAPKLRDLRISPNPYRQQPYGGGLGPKEEQIGGTQGSPKVNRGLGWSRGYGDDHKPSPRNDPTQEQIPSKANPQHQNEGGLGWNRSGPMGEQTGSPKVNPQEQYRGGFGWNRAGGPKREQSGEAHGSPTRLNQQESGLGWNRAGKPKEDRSGGAHGSPKVMNPQEDGLGWNRAGTPKGDQNRGTSHGSYPKPSPQEQRERGLGWNRAGKPKEDQSGGAHGSPKVRNPQEDGLGWNRAGTPKGDQNRGTSHGSYPKPSPQEQNHEGLGWNRGGPKGDLIKGGQQHGSPKMNPQGYYSGGYGSNPRNQFTTNVDHKSNPPRDEVGGNNQMSPNSNRQGYSGYGVPYQEDIGGKPTNNSNRQGYSGYGVPYQEDIGGKPTNNSNRQVGYGGGGYGVPYPREYQSGINNDSRRKPSPPKQEIGGGNRRLSQPSSNGQEYSGYGVPYRQNRSGNDDDQYSSRWKSQPAIPPLQEDIRGNGYSSPNSNRQGYNGYGVPHRTQDYGSAYEEPCGYEDHDGRWKIKPGLGEQIAGGKYGDRGGGNHVTGGGVSVQRAVGYSNILFYGRSGARVGHAMSSKEAAERFGGIYIPN